MDARKFLIVLLAAMNLVTADLRSNVISDREARHSVSVEAVCVPIVVYSASSYIKPESVSDVIERCASQYPNLRASLVEAVIFYESGYDPEAVDPNDSTVSGLMQVSRRWHQERANQLGVDLDTIYGNILTGCDYLSELITECGDERYALMCYNGGPDYGKRHWQCGDITAYAQSVFDRANQMEGGDSNGESTSP